MIEEQHRNIKDIQNKKRVEIPNRLQYTGLKDKNDKEIYEGDIMRLPDINGAILYLVKRVDNLFVLDDGMVIHINSAYFKERIVIGNIHENPELLEDKDA